MLKNDLLPISSMYCYHVYSAIRLSGRYKSPPHSPSAVRVEWDPIPETHRNGIITQYEVLFNQTSIASLPMSEVQISQNWLQCGLSATIHTLHSLCESLYRAGLVTNPTPVIIMTDPSGMCTVVQCREDKIGGAKLTNLPID